jgi:hypothetical protein
VLGPPALRATGDTTFTLDARRALPVTTGVEGVETDPSFVDLGYTRIDATEVYGLGASFGVGADLADGGLFAEPTDPVRVGQFEVELRARLLPAGTSPATAPWLYDLLLYGGAIPDPPDYVLSAAQAARLARVTAHYRNLNDRAEYAEGRIGFAPLQFAAGTGYDPLAVPRTRVEYLSPAPIQWFHLAYRYAQNVFIDYFGPTTEYQPGQRADEWWFGAPLRPDPYGDRGPTSMFVSVADFEDTGQHPGYLWAWDDQPVVEQALRLYRNGRLLASSTEPFLQTEVPGAQATYRLERDIDVGGLMGLANRSRTRWWFASQAPADPEEQFEPLPILSVDYQAAPLGGRNGAVAGQPVTVDLEVARVQGAPRRRVVATHLWFSTDDGGSWRKVRLRRLDPGRYQGVLPGSQLRPGTYVSLRTWARDAGNSRVHQTLRRAFPVR